MPYESNVDDFEKDESSVKLNDAELDAQAPAGIVDDDNAVSADSKNNNDEHSLEVRRAIEDHLERNRLQKELDYLFDEHFTDEE